MFGPRKAKTFLQSIKPFAPIYAEVCAEIFFSPLPPTAPDHLRLVEPSIIHHGGVFAGGEKFFS
jgi:hypothetical protein